MELDFSTHTGSCRADQYESCDHKLSAIPIHHSHDIMNKSTPSTASLLTTNVHSDGHEHQCKWPWRRWCVSQRVSSVMHCFMFCGVAGISLYTSFSLPCRKESSGIISGGYDSRVTSSSVTKSLVQHTSCIMCRATIILKPRLSNSTSCSKIRNNLKRKMNVLLAITENIWGKKESSIQNGSLLHSKLLYHINSTLECYSIYSHWIVTCMSVTIDKFWIDDWIYWTLWYSTWTTLYNSLLPTEASVHSHVFTSCCSVAASNGGRSPSSGSQNYSRPQLPASHSNSSWELNLSSSLTHWLTNSVTHLLTQLNSHYPTVPLIISLYGLHRKHHSTIAVQLLL
jgi:hypothetical protein